MPRVPETQLGNAAPNPMRSPSAPLAQTNRKANAYDFGIPQLGEVSRSIGKVQALMIDEQEKANKIRTMEADREFSESLNELLYGDNGALTKQGRNAFGVPQQTLEQVEARYREIHDNLANDNQREVFARLYNQRRPQVERTLLRYERGEIDKYQSQQQDAYAAQAGETIALNYNNPEVVATELQRIEDTRNMQGADDGLAPEVVDLKIREDESRALGAAVSRAISNRDHGTAKQLLDQYGDKMSPAVYDRAKETLRVAGERAAVRAHVDRITMSGGDLISQIQAARQIGGEVGEKVRDGVMRFQREQEMLRNEQKRINSEHAFTILEAANGDRDAIPDELWASLDSQARDQLDAASDRIAMRDEPPTYYPVLNALETMAANDPKQFAELDIYGQFGGHLDLEDRRRLKGIQDDIRNGTKTKLTHLETPTTLISTVMEANADGDEDLAKNPQLESHLLNEVQVYVTSFEANNDGRKPDPVSLRNFVQEAYDRALIEGRVRDMGFWGRDVKAPLYALDRANIEARAAFYVPIENIPDAEVKLIKDQIREAGLAVTDENIERWYADSLM